MPTELGETPTPWPFPVKLAVSAALTWHLFAVVAGVFAAPPASELQRSAFRVAAPYLQLVDQGTSYRYYAPNPAPTPVAFAELSWSDGRTESVRIPDGTARPRLLHQRYLNLAHALMQDDREARRYGASSHLARSMARHLVRTRNADEVTLLVRMHAAPTREEVAEAQRTGRRLDFEDERYYTARERVGSFTRGELGL